MTESEVPPEAGDPSDADVATRVLVDIDDGIADVRLTRGERHNALDRAMFAAIDAAIVELASNRAVRAVVLSGEGPSFCSGLDVASFTDLPSDLPALLSRRDGDPANLVQRVSYGWQRMPAPVIAAVHGNCFGGGLQIALGADIRFAHPDAQLSVMEVKYGLVPDMGVTRALPRLVGIDVAKELLFTGRVLNGAQALEIGLVTHLAQDPYRAALALCCASFSMTMLASLWLTRIRM